MHESQQAPQCLFCFEANNLEQGSLYCIPGNVQVNYAHSGCIDQWFEQNELLNNKPKAVIHNQKILYSGNLLYVSQGLVREKMSKHPETIELLHILENHKADKLKTFLAENSIDQIEWNAPSIAYGTTLCALIADKIEYLEKFHTNEKFMTVYLNWLTTVSPEKITHATFDFFKNHPEYLSHTVGKVSLLQHVLKIQNLNFRENLYRMLGTSSNANIKNFFALYLAIQKSELPQEIKLPLNAQEWGQYFYLFGHPISQLIQLPAHAGAAATVAQLLQANIPYTAITTQGTLLHQSAYFKRADILNILLQQFVEDMQTRANKGDEANVGIYLLLINRNSEPLWKLGDEDCKKLVYQLFQTLGVTLKSDVHSIEVLESLACSKKINPQPHAVKESEMEAGLLQNNHSCADAVFEDLQDLGYFDETVSSSHTSVTQKISQRNQAMFREIFYDFLIGLQNPIDVAHWNKGTLLTKFTVTAAFFALTGVLSWLTFFVEIQGPSDNSSEEYSLKRGDPGKNLLGIYIATVLINVAVLLLTWRKELWWLSHNRPQAYLLEIGRDKKECAGLQSIKIIREHGASLTPAQITAINAFVQKSIASATITDSSSLSPSVKHKELESRWTQYHQYLLAQSNDNDKEPPSNLDLSQSTAEHRQLLALFPKK